MLSVLLPGNTKSGAEANGAARGNRLLLAGPHTRAAAGLSSARPPSAACGPAREAGAARTVPLHADTAARRTQGSRRSRV